MKSAKTLSIVIGCLLGCFFQSPPAQAIDAYLYLKDKMRPLYIQNIKFHFYKSHTGTEAIIVFIPEQGKYHHYAFDRLRDIEFQALAGSRNLQPIFKIRAYLEEKAHFLNVSLMPLSKISGIHKGRSWNYKLAITGDENEHAETLDKIHFKPW